MRFALIAPLLGLAAARLVTVRNDVLRYDTDGNVVDCHSGMILAVNNTFFMWVLRVCLPRLCPISSPCTPRLRCVSFLSSSQVRREVHKFHGLRA